MLNRKEKLAIFDLDGTLFDTNRVNWMAYNQALKKYNKEISYDYFHENCNGRHFRDFLPGIFPCEEKVLMEIHQEKKKNYKEYISEARPNAHLFEILNAMKDKYHVALVTTASRENTSDILTYFHCTELFDLVITAEQCKERKPSPEGFLMAMDYFRVSSSNTVIFEDSDVGIEAARLSGASVIKVETF